MEFLVNKEKETNIDVLKKWTEFLEDEIDEDQYGEEGEDEMEEKDPKMMQDDVNYEEEMDDMMEEGEDEMEEQDSGIKDSKGEQVI